MKKLLCMLAALLLCCAPALAEEGCGQSRPLPEGFQIHIQHSEPCPVEWYADALMIGDSITESLDLYDCIPGLHIEALIGQSAQGAINNRTHVVNGQRMTMADMVLALAPAKLLIMLGSNGLDNSRPPYVLPSYHKLLDYLLSQRPDMEIYLLAVTPVRDYVSEQHPRLTNANVQEFNLGLQELAAQHAVHYVDINTPLLDEAGRQADRACVSGDGMHLTREGAERIAAALALQLGEY